MFVGQRAKDFRQDSSQQQRDHAKRDAGHAVDQGKIGTDGVVNDRMVRV
jgi:hypothetical protein